MRATTFAHNIQHSTPIAIGTKHSHICYVFMKLILLQWNLKLGILLVAAPFVHQSITVGSANQLCNAWMA